MRGRGVEVAPSAGVYGFSLTRDQAGPTQDVGPTKGDRSRGGVSVLVAAAANVC